MFKKFVHIVDRISEISGKAFSFIVLPVVLLEAVEVVLRYVFNSPTDWTWELAALLAGGMFVMGAGWVLKEDRHVFPWYRKIAERCHERGLLVFFHTDGDLWKLLDDFVEIGVDVLHPIDPHCMDIKSLKEQYGDRLCFAGNVSNELLRSASPSEIEDRVLYLMKNVAPGGGFMLGSGNSVPEWSRFENYMAMRAAAFRYGCYPIRV